MRIFGGPKHPAQRQLTSGRFEVERDGQVAFLEYAFDGNVLELIHTEVPRQLRGMGIASSLAQSALEWAREHKVKVDVICPHAAKYLKNHPEYADLVLR
jgi:predicted GNAT family acetyltransferase